MGSGSAIKGITSRSIYREKGPCETVGRGPAAPGFLRVPPLAPDGGGQLREGNREELVEGGHHEASGQSSFVGHEHDDECEGSRRTIHEERLLHLGVPDGVAGEEPMPAAIVEAFRSRLWTGCFTLIIKPEGWGGR